jgi:hypothetical protein
MERPQTPPGGGRVSQLAGEHAFLGDLDVLLEALKGYQAWLRHKFPLCDQTNLRPTG